MCADFINYIVWHTMYCLYDAMYADDTLVYCSANNINELQECTQKCVTARKEWYDNNHLVINASKSSSMVVTTKQRDTFSN